jgi:LuxR family transcriptional regulator of csgAB operon
MEKSVYIVGPMKFQNELLASFLSRNTGFRCFKTGHFGDIDFDNAWDTMILLFDAANGSLTEFWEFISPDSSSSKLEPHVAFFNSPLHRKMHAAYRKAISRGLRGLFFETGSIHDLLKGVKSIAKGELWISREFLNSVVDNRGNLNHHFSTPQEGLTPREEEILMEIASGASNAEISEALNISYHTVKTHISNIFAKINVPNRFQAALWAVKNMELKQETMNARGSPIEAE